MPIQNNWDFGIGPAHAMKYTANIQPVIPISISEDWNLILRTIVPVIYQEALVNGRARRPVSVKVMPVWATPRRAFSFRRRIRWAAGFWVPGRWVIIPPPPGLSGRRQVGCGSDHRGVAADPWLHLRHSGQPDLVVRRPAGSPEVNATYLQPFVSYTTKTYTTFAVNTETTYNWQAHQATVPMNFMVQQLVKIGKQPIAFQAGYRYYVKKPGGGPDWGLRFTITFLFPK